MMTKSAIRLWLSRRVSELQAEDSEGFRVGLISAAAWLLAEYVRGGASIDRVMSDVRDHVQSRLPEIPLNKLN